MTPRLLRLVVPLLAGVIVLAVVVQRWVGEDIAPREAPASPVASASATPTVVGSAGLALQGRVIHDVNGNGALEPGEPGQPGWSVCLQASLDNATCAKTDSSGSYFLGIGFRLGTGKPVHFMPPALPVDGTGRPLGWVQTAPEVTVPYPYGFLLTEDDLRRMGGLDFGVRPAEAVQFTGSAWADAAPLPSGMRIQAEINGTVCGEAVARDLWGLGRTTFALTVFSAAERPGCGKDGDAIYFAADCCKQGDTRMAWHTVSGAEVERLNLTWGVVFAAYSGRVGLTEGREPPQGPVQAYVGNTLCDELRGLDFGSDFGTVSKPLIVPSAGLKAGCGWAGEVVTFTVGGIQANERVPWTPGFHELTLTLP